MGRTSHGAAHLPSSQKRHLTAKGVGETASVLGLATPSDFVRAYPMSREWLTLLFSSGEPTAADLYLKAPVARAANRMLGDAVKALLADFPDGRRLRVLEVGAGTGSATASVLPELPADRFDYTYTDISAGFFSEAEARFGGSEASIDYRVLDIGDADVTPENGVWFVTRGAQVLEHERGGQLSGALLWGVGKVVAREAVHLQPRMIDLDPGAPAPLADLANELLYPDPETHIAYRLGVRQVARLVRAGSDTERLTLPDATDWLIEPDAGGDLERLEVQPLPPRTLEPREIRAEIEATGLNFWDLFRALGVIDEGLLGGEFCGRVLEIGPDVSTVAVGDRIVGLAFGAFGSDVVTREEMVAPAPSGISATALGTMPTAFVSAALSFDLSGLEPGERVLIHAGAGGVGMAAIQLAQAAGAEVFATASARKQAFLRSLGVEHVFDSRQTTFGQEILDATGGEGVHVVLNSLTGPGFIDASLSCLANGGRFVELARVDILSEEEMSAARPDVAYWILQLDVLKEHYPAEPGDALRRVLQQLAAGEISPIIHTRWSLAETGPAMRFMAAARHIGKIVLTASPIERGRLREDRTYLVTGGLGGIGCAVAEWLADRGAGAIVLNGRRGPSPHRAVSKHGTARGSAELHSDLLPQRPWCVRSRGARHAAEVRRRRGVRAAMPA